MIHFALAAYNEEKNIDGLLNSIYQAMEPVKDAFRIIIVDDGSKDKTAEKIMSYENQGIEIQVIRQTNQGFTAALQRALKTAIQERPKDDICITMDADNTHPAELVAAMIDKIRSGSDMVIASRFVPGGKMIGVPWARQIFSWGASLLMRLTIRPALIKDYSTAFRAYKVDLLERAFSQYGDRLFEGKGFSGIAASCIRFLYCTDKIAQIPLVLRYDLKQGVSGINIGSTIIGYLQIIKNYILGNYKPSTPREELGNRVP